MESASAAAVTRQPLLYRLYDACLHLLNRLIPIDYHHTHSVARRNGCILCKNPSMKGIALLFKAAFVIALQAQLALTTRSRLG